MGLYRTNAIVLRSIKLSETDKLVTFMTEEFGKVKCVAKGARKIKSRFAGSLEPMTYVYLIYFGKENQQLYSLNSADIIQSFHLLRDDFQKLYTGIYLNELVDASVTRSETSSARSRRMRGETNGSPKAGSSMSAAPTRTKTNSGAKSSAVSRLASMAGQPRPAIRAMRVRVKAESVDSMKGMRTRIELNITRIFGTKDKVISWIWVNA